MQAGAGLSNGLPLRVKLVSQHVSVAAVFGMPVSTTHAITTSIIGVGCAKRFSALNLTVVQRILLAWVFTLPAAGLMAYIVARVWKGG